MSHTLRLLAILTGFLVIGCASKSRTPFTPQSGPPTVGMPASLSDRERLFVPDIEASLRDNGLLPVRHGAGEMELEFTMDSGPVNTNTRIALRDGRRTVASGSGRASGLPLVGRSTVAENSFKRAFDEFEVGLSRAGGRRGWDPRRIPTDPARQDAAAAIY